MAPKSKIREGRRERSQNGSERRLRRPEKNPLPYTFQNLLQTPLEISRPQSEPSQIAPFWYFQIAEDKICRLVQALWATGGSNQES
jgi:hypothetical protein